MSLFRNEEITCPLCGKTFSSVVVSSFQVDGSLRGLDGDPHEPLIYDLLHLCPHCGYVFTDQKKEPDPFTKMLAQSENYQVILHAEDCPDPARKSLLKGYLAEQKEETEEAAVQYLRAYWCFRNNGLSGLHEARDKAIEAMERYLEDNVDKNAALALIDLLRQKGAFDEALETVNSLGKYLRGEENLLKIAAFEWRLIMEEDQESHLMMEMNG